MDLAFLSQAVFWIIVLILAAVWKAGTVAERCAGRSSRLAARGGVTANVTHEGLI